MRFHLHGDIEAVAFAEMLINVGDGKANIVQPPDTIRVAKLGSYATSVNDLIDKVFLNFQENVEGTDWLSERGILAPLNESVTKINSKLIGMMPSSSNLYKSINTAVSDDEATHYPPEFLNSIETSGLPPHKLNIKVGMPVIVLRSLNPPRLMNGTRCIVTKPMRNVIEVKIAAGLFKNKTHLIPLIRLQPSYSILPFIFPRQQFPLRPCFGLTINKAQGQTLQIVGLDLRTPLFSHGMLYVALSRTGRKDAIHILTEGEATSNVATQRH